MKKLAPKDVKTKSSVPQAWLCCSGWVGGSTLASLSTLQKMWVSKNEYKEDGSHASARGERGGMLGEWEKGDPEPLILSGLDLHTKPRVPSMP